MEGFTEEIRSFLHASGRRFTECCAGDITVFDEEERPFSVIAVPIREHTAAEAEERARRVSVLRGDRPWAIILPEDRWRRSGAILRARLSAHLGTFRSVFARDCEVRRAVRPEADAFFDAFHSYGAASARFRYGLFTKKEVSGIPEGSLVAAASFSNARRFTVGNRSVASHEWIRYASLPDVRVTGGMGKVLQTFIRDAGPEDVMSYADREWSEGEVYRRLGFRPEGLRAPVLFSVDPVTWERKALRNGDAVPENALCFMNWGSVKYRLTLLP